MALTPFARRLEDGAGAPCCTIVPGGATLARRRPILQIRNPLPPAGDQIQAALDLLTYALDQGMLDVDRWLLETAVARLRLAVEQLGEGTAP